MVFPSRFLGLFYPDGRKLRSFGIVSGISILIFAFILKGVDIWILFWGWALLWPILLLQYLAGGIDAGNIYWLAPLGLLLQCVYWYVFACVAIAIKDHIESE